MSEVICESVIEITDSRNLIYMSINCWRSISGNSYSILLL